MKLHLSFPVLALACLTISLHAQSPQRWESLHGPAQCVLGPFVVGPSGKLFLGYSNGGDSSKQGLYQSADNGVTWTGPAMPGLVVTGLIALPNGFVFAAARHTKTSPNGVYRSTDDGQTWARVFVGKLVDDVTIDGGGRLFAFDYEVGIWRSTDLGQTWDSVNVGLSERIIWSLCEDGNGVLYAGCGSWGGVYRSTNHGGTWENMLTRMSVYGIATGKDGAIFAAGIADTTIDRLHPGVAYRSTNGGASWTQIYWGNYANTVFVNSRGTVFLCTGYPLTGCAMYRSTDNGDSWTQLTNFQRQRWNSLGDTYCGAHDYLYSGGDGLLRSTDDGDTWTSMNCGFASSFVPALSMDARGMLIAGSSYYGSYFGMYQTSNKGKTWWIRNEGQSDIWTILSSPDGTAYAGGSSGVQKSADGGQRWTSRTPIPGGTVYALALDPQNRIYAGSVGVFRSTDGGTNWSEFSNGLSKKFYTSALAVHPNGALFAGTFGNGIYSSTNGGAHWIATSAGLSDSTVYSLSIDPTGPIYAGTLTGLFLSNDSGKTWARAPEFPMINATVVTAVAGGEVYVGTHAYVFYSPNRGNPPWYQLVSGLTKPDVSSIVVGNDGYVYAGTWGAGVFRIPAIASVSPTVPGLVHPIENAVLSGQGPMEFLWRAAVPVVTHYWLEIATDSLFQSSTVDSLVADTTSFVTGLVGRKYWWRVRASNSMGWGEYSVTRTFRFSTMGVKDEAEMPLSFFLGENYPNPFNATTKVGFVVGGVVAPSGSEEPAVSGQQTAASHVRLVVYDLLGREVAVLIDERKEPGKYEVTFDGTNLTSGVYFYRMQAGNYLETKKFLLLK
jgi:photosystem II stability/assembly factor-like uncharacterized protein